MGNVLSGVGVLDKAMAVVSVVEEGGRTLQEICARTGYSRPTAYRLVAALEAHELLRRDGDGTYHPGRRLRPEPVASLEATLPLLAAGVLDELHAQTGESVQLYRRVGWTRLCVAAREKSSGLRDTVPVGAQVPMTAGGAAQVLLAWAPDDVRARLLPRAIWDASTLGAVRRNGWAESLGERDPAVGSISAPVFGGGGVVAAISVSGPAERVAARRDALRRAVVRGAARLTGLLEEYAR